MAGDTSGLHYDSTDDDAMATLRQQARSVSHNLQIDTDRSSTFALAAPGATEMTDGLLAADDPEALAELLRKHRDREPDLRLRRLLERAEHAVDRGDLPAALRLVEEALELDRTSGTAWLLKGRCLIAAGDFARADRAIAVARRYARDRHGMQLADAMSADCHRAEMTEFAAHLTDLVDEGRVAEARRQVQQRLRDQPEDPTLLQNHCALLLLSGDVATARQVAENALRTVDRLSASRFEELLRHVAQRECEPRIHDARLALRRGRTAAAVAHLEACVAALGDDEKFAVLRSFAMKRHAEASSHGVVRLLRRRRDDTGPVDRDALQWLLEWLLQEELDAGTAALRAGRFQDAQRQFTAADMIDARCALVAYLHAAAVFRELVHYLETDRDVRLDHAHTLLVRARDLAARSADDPTIGGASRELGETIGGILAAVDAVRAQVARAQAIANGITRYNTLMQHYQRYPIRTPEQRDTARRSFEKLAQDVSRLQREGSSPEEAATVQKLTAALASVRSQLRGR